MSLKAYGAVLEYGNTADHATATAWTAVARAKSITPGKVSAADIDTTVLTSPDEAEEVLPGLASNGEFEATVEYDKTATGTLYGFFRTVKAWRLRYADDSGWKFNGYINEIGDDEVVNGEIVTTAIKIKPTGKPVHVADFTP
jgi:hypothetical protein